MSDQTRAAMHDQARKAASLVPVDVTPEDTVRIADAVSAVWSAENERLRDLLTDIYLYIDWRYITKQQTTQQKELFASVVEAAGMTVDRWWVDSSSRDLLRWKNEVG